MLNSTLFCINYMLIKQDRFRAIPLINHTLTNIDIIQRFLDVNFEAHQETGGTVEINGCY